MDGMPGLEALIPHRAPMCLIDRVFAFDAAQRTCCAYVSITPASPFFSGSGVPSWVALEYMAQTSAALAGLFDRMREASRPPRPGLLLGARKLALDLDGFENGRVYTVCAKETYSDGDAAAFDCAVMDDTGACVASATLNAYRPGDFASFLADEA